MNQGDPTASVGVGEIEKRILTGAGAGGGEAGDLALIKVDGAGVEVGGSAVGDSGEFQVVGAILGAAADGVAAIGDAGFVERSPAAAVVESCPDTLVIIVGIDVPDVHFIATRDDGEFASINGTSGRVRIWGTSAGVESGAGLVGETGPVEAVERGIKAVVAERGEEHSRRSVVDDSGGGTGVDGDGAVVYGGVGPGKAAVGGVVKAEIRSDWIGEAFDDSLGCACGCGHGYVGIRGVECDFAEGHACEGASACAVGGDQSPGCAGIERAQDAETVIGIG